MKPAALKLYLIAGALLGLAALLWLLWGRSMERNAWLLGYSANRLALAFALLLPLALISTAAWGASRRPDRLARAAARIDDRLLARDRIVAPLLVCLAMAAAAGIFLALTARLPSPGLDEFLSQFSPGLPLLLERFTPVITRLRPALAWLALLAAGAASLLLDAYPAAYRQKARAGVLGRAAVVTLLLLLAAAHWVILFFRLKTLLVIPGWKWYFHDKPVTPGGLALFGVLLALTLALAWWITRAPSAARRWLVALVLLGAAWQITFGYLEGGGFESLRVKYAGSVFNNYAEAAAREPGWLAPLRDYESLYARDWYLGTKPPGVLFTYIVIQKLSNLVDPVYNDAARFLRLTTFSAYVFPFLSMLVLLPLTRLARELTGEDGALVPALLYLAIPSVILIPLFLDQVLYPLVFTLILLLALAVMRRGSLALAFACGFSICIALYLSFSLIPLIPLVGTWLALDGWLNRRERPLRRTLALLLALAAGALAGLLLFRLALNYDILLRYTRAMAQHQRAKEFQPGLPALLEAVQLNQAEFVTWSGPALILLFLLSIPVYLRSLDRPGSLLLAFLLSYLALNLLGQTRGEVQRLWLFLLPLVSLFAAPRARRLFAHPWAGTALLLFIQLTTTLLIFTFQDFYG